MTEEWFVRVGEKEYGPVDLETLREWKTEGRLLAENPVRKDDETTWSTAASIPDLFVQVLEPTQLDDPIHRRTFGEILSESFRIYRRGFWQFFALSLLVALPSLVMSISREFVNYHEGEVITMTTRVAAAIAIVMLVLVLVAWPIFVAGLQFAASDLASDRTIRIGPILRRAINFWPRITKLCLFVYGSYIFWTILPVLAILALAGNLSVLSVLLALVALAFQVYMVGRLFINFLFWQQTATLGQREGVEALQESRALARSQPEAPRMQRPLYRGALIASLWLVILLVFSFAIELPFLLVRLEGVTTFEQGYALIQSIVNAPAPDAMTIATDVLSSLLHAALRPLLGIAFVVLYFDAKATR
ncbi:MAG: DUF4339 domain-containing protein [Chthoniobacterales bacterium]